MAETMMEERNHDGSLDRNHVRNHDKSLHGNHDGSLDTNHHGSHNGNFNKSLMEAMIETFY